MTEVPDDAPDEDAWLMAEDGLGGVETADAYLAYPEENDPYYDEDYSAHGAHAAADFANRRSPYICLHCLSSFISNNKLHAHLLLCKPHHIDASITHAFYTIDSSSENTHLPTISSTRPRTDLPPGEGYRSWKFASTIIGIQNANSQIVACLDTGCKMTIIDAALAKSLGVPIRTCKPVAVSGIGSKHISEGYIDLQLFLRGTDNIAKLDVEAHLVSDLKALLLIGMDVMGKEGFRLDFDAKTARISSCMGITVPIHIHAKPNHHHERAVYANEKVVIPPHSYAKIPVRCNEPLPPRGFIFEGRNPVVSFYTHLVDQSFPFVEAVNESQESYTISRRTRIGTLFESDETMAWRVSADVAELARSIPTGEPTYEPAISLARTESADYAI
ncbi:hypothetical protein N7495_008300, partial [Penicillium taxi]|uniref:uncharacterized protein n=1 Tax=Penicillium taxi TaxID=168475 RepID=UPI0025458065